MVTACAYVLSDDHWFLATSLEATREFGPAVCFVSRRAWDGSEACFERVVEVAEAQGAEVVLGDWSDETSHRGFALAEMRRRGHRHILIPDGDEVPEARLLGVQLGYATSYGYDSAGRPQTVQNARGFVTTTIYNARDAIARIDALGNRWTTVYDALDRDRRCPIFRGRLGLCSLAAV